MSRSTSRRESPGDRVAALERMGIEIHSTSAGSIRAGWPKGSTHWRVEVLRAGAFVQTPFSMGSAHKGEPKTEDVIHSLLMDMDILSMSFAEYCKELGLDRGSVSTRYDYNRGREVCDKFRAMFTAEELEELRELFADY